ncbi:MAG: DUF6364 family protein [Gammaproteobacteria bacterium]|nr:DUF6364 family protein [Gammaproteobacteria bacterium]
MLEPKMKTTLNLNDDLVTRAKMQAARQRTTLTRLIEEGLQLRLREGGQPGKEPAKLPVRRRQGRTGAGPERVEQQGVAERRRR